jgi:type I restriction enzyme, S subunit
LNRPIDLRLQDQVIVEQILRKVLPSSAKVWAFGSRARWTARDGSDLDLAIDAGRPLSSDESAKLRNAFEDSDLPFTVDVVDWMTISEEFRQVIGKDKIRLFPNLDCEQKSTPDWRTAEASELCSLIVDCINKTAPTTLTPTPYKMIRTTNVRSGRVNTTDCKYVNKETFLKWTRRASVEQGDILLTREAPIGEVGKVRTDEPIFLGQRLMQYRADPEKLDPDFLYYSFLSPALKQQFISFGGSGSVVDHIRVPDCFKFKISYPPLQEQKAIAFTLTALDDKIELNRRMNETLEAMARALFKSWFVDFDPVHAKAEARDTGISSNIAALFPDSFVSSELGKIPRGWHISGLLDHASLLSGGTPKTDNPEYWNGRIAWASAKDVSQASSLFLIKTERSITECGLAKSSTRIIPAMSTVIVARGATTGRMVLFGREMAMNQTCYAMVSKNRTPFTLYHLLCDRIADLLRAAHGSVFDTITTSTFAQSRAIIPHIKIMEEFESLVEPLHMRILNNIQQSEILSKMRDALLPKLISGELRISDVERILEKSA